MATKLYLESSGTPAISPTPNAAWTDTTQLLRLNAGTVKAGSTMTTKHYHNSSNAQADVIFFQFITPQLSPGQTITGAQTVNIQMRCAETNAADNSFLSWAVYIFNGTTLQKTIITKRNDATEFAQSTLTNRTDSATSVAGNYTTVAGDQIVIEIGPEGDPTGADNMNADLSYGSDSATDLPSDDTTTVANNPNVILNDTLTFASAETITADKWHPEIQKPIFELTRVVSYMRNLVTELTHMKWPSFL